MTRRPARSRLFGMTLLLTAACAGVGGHSAFAQETPRGGGGARNGGAFGKEAEAPATGPAETRVALWPTLSDAQQKEAVGEQKAAATEATKNLKRVMKLRESDHFLLYSDADPRDVELCSTLLEKAYARSTAVLGIAAPKVKNVYRGKALVYVFERLEDYEAFNREGPTKSRERDEATPAAPTAPEGDVVNRQVRPGGGGGPGRGRGGMEDLERMFRGVGGSNRALPGASHPSDDGTVQINLPRHPDDSPADGRNGDGRTEDQRFARALVHRAVLGVLYRFHSPEPLGAWVADGLGHSIASELVPANNGEPAVATLAKNHVTRSNGVGDLFRARALAGGQHAVAETLSIYMVRLNKAAYPKFVEGLKSGYSYQESLKAHYKTTPAALLNGYGQAIGARIDDN